MFLRTLLNTALFIFIFFVCMLIDARIGLHVFTLGFLLASLLFTTAGQIIFLLLFFSCFNDVRFIFPLGLTFLLTSPFYLIYPFLIPYVRYRMALLYGYLVVAASISTFFQYKEFTSPTHVFWICVWSGVWVAVVYAYSIKMFQRSFGIKAKLRF